MLYFTTGGISKVKTEANFTWTAKYCPAGTHGFGVNQGGGDFHIFDNVSEEQQDAAWKLVQYLTTPENAALWSAASGYIAVNKGAYDTEIMKIVLQETPQYLVARNQLDYSHPQMMSNNIMAVREALKGNLDELVEEKKSIAEVQADGQAEMVALIGAPSTSTPSNTSSCACPSEGGDRISSASLLGGGACVGLTLELGLGGIVFALFA
jgi:sn-glycerol 3-phosphate transport system substrate-binding protein